MEPIGDNKTIIVSGWDPKLCIKNDYSNTSMLCSQGDRGSNTFGIIGLILATISLFLLIVLAIYCSFKRRSSRLPTAATDSTQNYQVAMSNKLLIVSNLLIIIHYQYSISLKRVRFMKV